MRKFMITVSVTLMSMLNADAQIDSMSMKTGPFNLQTSDAEYISYLLADKEAFQAFLDDLSTGFRNANQPTGSSLIGIDSVKVGTLLSLSSYLRGLCQTSYSKEIYGRIQTAIKACNNSFLLNQLNVLDKKEEEIFNKFRQDGRKKLAQGF